MEDWNIIECGFNVNDETINFGSRSFTETDNLFEVSTLATLRDENNDTNFDPQISALVKSGRIIFTINKTLKIFENLACSALSFNVTFDVNIDCFCLNKSGEYLLLCLQNGTVHIFNVKNEQNIIYSGVFSDSDEVLNEPFFSACFLENDDNLSFIIIFNCGKIMRFTKNETEVDQGEKFKFDTLTNIDFDSNITCASYNNPVLCICTEKSIYFYDMVNNFLDPISNDFNIKEIFSCNNDLFLAIDMEGNILQISSNTLLIFYLEMNVAFEDLVLIKDDSNMNCYIFGVTKECENEQFIQLIKFPEMSTLFSLKLKYPVHLIHLENINDEYMFISKLNSNGNISELRFQVVYETLPEKRLERLIRKRKFEEAEKFAIEYNIDLTVIKKAKAELIVQKQICKKEDIDDLLSLFESINDYAFKLQCCIDVEGYCSNFEDVKRILNYGTGLIAMSSQTNESDVIHLENTVSNLMYRFDTFMTIYLHNSEKYDMQDWKKFALESDMFEYFMLHLKMRHYQECIIIYNHFDSFTLSKLNEARAEIVLNELDTMYFEDYIPFLYSFVPITLKHLPSTLPIFVNWLLKKIFEMERFYSDNFPSNAIQFTDKLFSWVKVEGTQNINFQRQYCLNKEAIDELLSLIQALEQLRTLKENYKIAIPLTDYLQGPEVLIKTLLSISFPKNEYKYFLEHFLIKYMVENGLNPDEIFMEKIKDLLKYEEKYWLKMIPLFLKCIHSEEIKIMSVLEILKIAEVPWSEEVREITKIALTCSHPLVANVVKVIEEEPRVIVQNKSIYELANEQLNNIDDLEFFIKRMITCNTSTLIEDVHNLCRNNEEKQFAKIILIRHFIDIGYLEDALKILYDNAESDIVNCCKKITRYYYIHISSEETAKNYLKICGTLYSRILKNVKNSTENYYYSKQHETLLNFIRINKHFKKNISISDINDEEKKQNICDELIDELILSFKNNYDNFRFYVQKCNVIASCLNIPHGEVLLKFCKEIRETDYILEIANDFYLFETNSRYLCCISLLVLRSLGTLRTEIISQETTILEETMIFEDFNVTRKKFTEALILSEKLLAKAIINCEPYDFKVCIEILKFSQLLFYFTHSLEFKPKNLAKNLFLGNNTNINMASARWLVNYCSNLLEPVVSNLLQDFNKYSEVNHLLSEKKCLEEIKNLPMTLQKLHTEGHYLTSYKLVTTFKDLLVFQFSNVNPSVLDSVKNLLMQYMTFLFKKVLSAQHVDTELAYSLLLSYDSNETPNQIMKSLALYKRDIRKFEIIARLGLRFENKFKSTCKKLIPLMKWYNKIENNPVPYDDFFQIESLYLAMQLIKHNVLNLNMILEFCHDFDCQSDCQVLLMKYLKSILFNWKPNYEVKTDLCGTKELIIKNSEEELFKMCSEVIELISDKEAVYGEIQKLWNHINFYHYEVFICILKISSGFKNKENITNKLVLSFLKNYRRISKPKQTENEQWYTCFPDSQDIDPLSEWRLPFSPILFTKDIWNIIRAEINLKTYTTWFKIASILKNLNKNDICSFVVKEEVSKISKSSHDNKEWNIVERYKDLFKEIDACVQNISDIQQATSAIYHVFIHTPPGADQVNAISMCYKYALKYKEKESEIQGLKESFIKVEKKYFNLCTLQILHKNKVADKKYVELVCQPPEKLIEALYADERILKRTDYMIIKCPDINKAVDEIATLHNLDIEKMRMELLNCWLSDVSMPNINFETSLPSNIYFHGDGFLDSDINEKNIKRASYMCSSGNLQFWQRTLVKIGLKNDTKHTSYKARALKCLCTISDASIFEDLTGSTYEQFLNYVQKLFLISDLEYLGFSMDIETLDKCNKRDLLKQLAQDRHNSANIKVMASICSTYTIYEIKFWKMIINAMIEMKMLKELKEYLNFLKRGDTCQYKKFHKEAWQNVIDLSFNFATNLTEEDLTLKCIENLHLVQSCPVLSYLNLENALEKCKKVKKYTFAAVLLQYLPEIKQRVNAKELLELDKNLCEEILEMEEYGFWGINYVKNILNNES